MTNYFKIYVYSVFVGIMELDKETLHEIELIDGYSVERVDTI